MKAIWVALVVLGLVSVACSSEPVHSSVAGSPFAPSMAPPRLDLPGMTSAVATVDAEAVAADGVHGDIWTSELHDAGFVGGVERAMTGGSGPFSRVVTRRLTFASAGGAATFASWLSANANAELFPVGAFEVPGAPADMVVLRHLPGGCCPREVPIYLAVWRRGSDVVTMLAQGPRSTDRAAAQLVLEVAEEEA